MTPEEQQQIDFAAQLRLVAPARIVTRSFRDRDRIPDAELLVGVFTVISSSGEDFASYIGRNGAFGTRGVLLIGQMLVEETDDELQGLAVERAEFEMVADVSRLLQSLPESCGGAKLKKFQQSGQIERPYGWVLFHIAIGP